jgi:glycosidase
MEKIVEFGNSRFVYHSKSGLPLRWEGWNGNDTGFLFHEPFVTLELNGFSPTNDEKQMTSVRETTLAGRLSEMVSDEVKTISRQEKTLAIHTKINGLWELTTFFHYMDPVLAVRLEVKSCDSQRNILRAVRFHIGGMAHRQLSQCELLMPGHLPELSMPIDLHRKLDTFEDHKDIGTRKLDEPGNSPSIMGTYHSGTAEALLSWWISDTFPMKSRLAKQEEQLVREGIVYCPCELQQGENISLGVLNLALMQGKRKEVLKEAAKSFCVFEREEPHPVPNQERLKICELHIGEKMGLKRFDHYDQIMEQIGYLKRLGYNTVEVMPAFPFPSYSVYDYFNLDKTYGSGPGLNKLVHEAKRLGLKVILDMVLHGPLDKEPEIWSMPPGDYRFDSPYLNDRTEWFSRHESGDYARTYTRSFDLANPELQDHIADAILFYASEVGVDGIRLDAQMWNFFPNWQPGDGRRPYESIYAGYRMMEKIRAAVLERYPHFFFYTEGIGPLMAKCHDYRYNYDFHWIYPALSRIQDKRGMSRLFWNPASENTLTWHDLAEWLEEQRIIVPRGISVVHQTDSHDAHEWAGFWQGQFNREVFGPELHRVYVAMALFMEGSFMSYFGAELGNEAFYADLLPMKDLPLFSQGTCSYTDVRTSDPKVFCIMWRYENEWAIVLGNLESRDKEIGLTASPDLEIGIGELGGGILLCDLVRRRELTVDNGGDGVRLGLHLNAFGVVVLTNKRRLLESFNYNLDKYEV